MDCRDVWGSERRGVWGDVWREGLRRGILWQRQDDRLSETKEGTGLDEAEQDYSMNETEK